MNTHETFLHETGDGEFIELTQNQISFLSAYRQTGVIRQAAESAQVDRTNHSRWLRESPDYAKAFDEAKRDAVDTLEIEARKRAIDGLRSYKFHHGMPIQNPLWKEGDPEEEKWYYETSFSDRLLELLLRAHRPEVYRDHQSIEVAGEFQVEQQLRRQLIENPESADLLCQALEALTDTNQGATELTLPLDTSPNPEGRAERLTKAHTGEAVASVYVAQKPATTPKKESQNECNT